MRVKRIIDVIGSALILIVLLGAAMWHVRIWNRNLEMLSAIDEKTNEKHAFARLQEAGAKKVAFSSESSTWGFPSPTRDLVVELKTVNGRVKDIAVSTRDGSLTIPLLQHKKSHWKVLALAAFLGIPLGWAVHVLCASLKAPRSASVRELRFLALSLAIGAGALSCVMGLMLGVL